MLSAQNESQGAGREVTLSGDAATDYLNFLLTHQNSDGGWGYHTALPSSVEATAWTLMAVAGWDQAATPAETCDRARAWLLQAQLPSGAWPAFPGQRQGCWVTSLATLALDRSGKSPEAEKRGLSWLLEAQPADASLWWRARRALGQAGSLVRQDSSLHGWSWTPGTASWVEPTSFVLLLLRGLPPEALPARAVRRWKLAERMLYDRMCDGGGWNSGNPLVYGVAGVPRIGPTVWALLALIDHAERRENQVSLDWLARTYDDIQGPASLALAHRCLAAYGRPVPPLAAKLGEFYMHNQYFESVLTAAWIVLAANSEMPARKAGVVP